MKMKRYGMGYDILDVHNSKLPSGASGGNLHDNEPRLFA